MNSGLVTVTLHVAVLLPSSVVTVMVAVPTLTPVTSPLLTVAIEASFVSHVTFLLVAFVGSTVAVREIVFPLSIETDV